MIGDNETHFPDKLLLTNRQVENLHKVFAGYLSASCQVIKNSVI